MISKFLNLIVVILPWRIKRLILIKFYNYEIAPSSRIGFSYIFPEKLILKNGAVIDHFNVAIHIESFFCGESSYIGRSNWFTGHIGNFHFSHRKDRDPSFYLGHNSAITKSHIFDCTDKIHIGDFTTIAGYRSQFLTHGINYEGNFQDCNEIIIGNYCLVGTCVNVIGGANLPDKCILSANSFLNKKFDSKHNFYLFGGVPAKPIKTLNPNSKYFFRNEGYVN